MNLTKISFALMATVFLSFSALLFSLGHYLLGLVPLFSLTVMFFMARNKINRESEYSLSSFIARHPDHLSADGFLTCPHCDHDQQQVFVTSSVTVGVHPFTRSSFDICCAECRSILVVEQSKKFRSTLALAHLHRPHRHKLGSLN